MRVLLLVVAIAQTVSASPRIVSLHPALTENLFAMGLGKNVVGTTEYSNFPEEAKEVPRIGDHVFSQEKIISLKPTHIVSISSRTGISKDLASKAKIKIVQVKFEELEDFGPAVQLLGEEFQKIEQAKTLIENWKNSWDKIKPQSTKESAVIQVQADPIVVAGQKTFLDSILSKCGVKNAIEPHGYPTLNRETLIKLSPTRVVLLLTDIDESIKESTAKSWKTVLKNRPLLFFDPNTISKLTPRLPIEAQKFCEVLR